MAKGMNDKDRISSSCKGDGQRRGSKSSKADQYCAQRTELGPVCFGHFC